ncbi:hypothetical protein EJ06DRAFT_585544 [Trichodelitschia bisporula]|uniref:Anaphase-promoting complex subunit 4 n=1 Tax=Trichodelitschia bisporula TaxID=703511 RepID=A0A6G1HJG9_9PEZI|nr:hypothetical protein EJ06DRAFT_585544 [Trichodelitschia bisporula]
MATRLVPRAQFQMVPCPSPKTIAVCPAMDLVAVADHDHSMTVYRFNGQPAFTLPRRSKQGEITCMAWKFNGQYLVMGWSDGLVEVIAAETGSVMQHFRQVAADGSVDRRGVTCIGWGINAIDVPKFKARTGDDVAHPFPASAEVNVLKALPLEDWATGKAPIDIEDFLDREPDLFALDMDPELPDKLARMDVTFLFPKLPALPAILRPQQGLDSATTEMFSNQAALDMVLHTQQPLNFDAVDSMIWGQGDGSLRVVLYDSLSLGAVELPDEWKNKDIRHHHHAWHPYSSTHWFLSEGKNQEGKLSTLMFPLTLGILRNSGNYIHHIESKTAQLETLVLYVRESLFALNYYWKSAKELPSRLKENMEEDLVEKEEADLIAQLYELACAGHCGPTLKEWLVVHMGDRNLKRWDHAMTTGYNKVTELLRDTLIPALDRCQMLLDSLKGLAIYHADSPFFNVPLEYFETSTNVIRCMRLIASHALLVVSQERTEYAIYAKWIRGEFVRLSSNTPPMTEPEPLDLELLLNYLEQLGNSKMDVFIQANEKLEKLEKLDKSDYDVVSAVVLEIAKGEEPDRQNRILNLHTHFEVWSRESQKLVGQITTWQRESSMLGKPIVLKTGAWRPWASRIRMVFEKLESSSDMTTYALVNAEDDRDQLHVFRTVHSDIYENTTSIHRQQVGIWRTGGPKIIDLDFIDDDECLVLVKEANEPRYHIMSCRFREPFVGPDIMDFDDNIEWEIHNHPVLYTHEARISTNEDTVCFMKVNGRKGKRYVMLMDENNQVVTMLSIKDKGEDTPRTLRFDRIDTWRTT